MKSFAIALSFVVVLLFQHCDSPKSLPGVVLRGSYNCKSGEVQITYSQKPLNRQAYVSLDDAENVLEQAGLVSPYTFDNFKKAVVDNCTPEQSNNIYPNDLVYRPNENPAIVIPIQGGLLGVLTTTGNASVVVNGISAGSGATLASGTTIETSDKVGATIRLGRLGSLCIAPNTKVVLEFDAQPNTKSKVKLNLLRGCGILRVGRDTIGEVYTSKGVAAQMGPMVGGSSDVCFQPGSAGPVVNQGAAVDSGAGASAVDCGAAGAAAMPPGGIRLPRIWPRRHRQRISITELQPNNGSVNITGRSETSLDPGKKTQYLKERGIEGCKQTSDNYVKCPNGKAYFLSPK